MTNFVTYEEAVEKLNSAVEVIVGLLQVQIISNQTILINKQKSADYDNLLEQFNNLYHQIQYKDGYKLENDFLWSIMQLTITQRQAVDNIIEYAERLSKALDEAHRHTDRTVDKEGKLAYKEGDIIITMSDELANLISRELTEQAEQLKQQFWLTKEDTNGAGS